MKAAVARLEQPQNLGEYRGFEIHVEAHNKGCQFVLEGMAGYYTPISLRYERQDQISVGGLTQRLENNLMIGTLGVDRGGFYPLPSFGWWWWW